MAEHHRVEWSIERENVYGRLVCVAPEGSICRLTCGEKCGSETYPCYSYDDAGEERAHELVDQGECNAELCIENSGEALDLFYDGESHAALRSDLVEVDWDGDMWVWRYPKAGGSDG